MSIELSNYQKNILNFIDNSSANLLVDAKAGSGKTFTLCQIANKILDQNKKCLFLAFNKSIVNELQQRILSNRCQIKTLHSLGLTFLKSYLYKKHGKNYDIEIDTYDDKIKNLVLEYFIEFCDTDFNKATEDMDISERGDLRKDVLNDISQMVNFCRLYNINYHEPKAVYKLGYDLCWNLKEYKDFGLMNYPLIIEKTINQIKIDFENPILEDNGIYKYIIGYTDMIYFPSLYKMNVPFSLKEYLDYIMCDESQDLSILQQLFLKLLITSNNRIIFIGDKNQSIYAFAGADTHSIDNIKKNFVLNQLPLDICYRCPENVIKVAKQLVPSIDWNHDREDKGIVEFIDILDLSKKIDNESVLLARRNADLLALYKYLVLDKKISVKFKNKEMVNSIVNEIKKVIKEYIRKYNKYLNVEKELYTLCDNANIDWKRSLKKMSEKDRSFIEENYKLLIKEAKLKSKTIIKSNYTIDYLKTCMLEYKEFGEYNFTYEDMENTYLIEYFDIIYSLLEDYINKQEKDDLKEFIIFIESFLTGNLYNNAPILSSIHMMKGGEANKVFIYDYPRFPYIYNSQSLEAQQQESNLQYVAITRAKKELYLLRIFKCKGRETKDDINKLNSTSEMAVMQILKRGSK